MQQTIRFVRARVTRYASFTQSIALSVLMVGILFVSPTWSGCNAPVTKPSSDFTVHHDGTITHLTTGLMWKVCAEGKTWSAGNCTGSASRHTWDKALKIPQSVNAGGYPLSGRNYTDWRLPNLKELKSIVELQCFGPAINEGVFPATGSSWYWSSSPNANHGRFASGVDFYGGNFNDYVHNNAFRVRLVRSGQ